MLTTKSVCLRIVPGLQMQDCSAPSGISTLFYLFIHLAVERQRLREIFHLLAHSQMLATTVARQAELILDPPTWMARPQIFESSFAFQDVY